MEMHMVHVNSKYVKDDGTIDPATFQDPNGLAVLGFMFKVKSCAVTNEKLWHLPFQIFETI